MNGEEQQWQKDLKRELLEAHNHFTRDRYPATLETQQCYQQKLSQLADSNWQRLDDTDHMERVAYDADFRSEALRKLDVQERAQWPTDRKDNDLWDIRAKQKPELGALREPGPENPSPAYRQLQTYREGMQQLTNQQAARRDQADQAIRLVSDKLDERFGFMRSRDQDRER